MNFEERIKSAEKRLGIKLPIDYIKFIEEHEGFSFNYQ